MNNHDPSDVGELGVGVREAFLVDGVQSNLEKSWMKTSFKTDLPTITWKTIKTACNAVNTTTPAVAPTVREPEISSSYNLKPFSDHAIMPPYLTQELCWLNDSNKI